jgi:hypothetical protein
MTGQKRGVIVLLNVSRLTAIQELAERAIQIGNFGIFECDAIEDPATSINHSNKQTLGILGEPAKPRNKSMVLVGKDGAVGLADKEQHFNEMIEVIIDGQDG